MAENVAGWEDVVVFHLPSGVDLGEEIEARARVVHCDGRVRRIELTLDDANADKLRLLMQAHSKELFARRIEGLRNILPRPNEIPR